MPIKAMKPAEIKSGGNMDKGEQSLKNSHLEHLDFQGLEEEAEEEEAGEVGGQPGQ